METRQIWMMFGRWPLWAKIGAWVLAWPVLAAVVIDSHTRGRAGRILAVAVLGVFGLGWFGALAGVGSPPETEQLAAPAASTVATLGDADAEPPVIDDKAAREGSAIGEVGDTTDSDAATGDDRAHATAPLPDGVPEGSQPATVAKIIDGDTIRVRATDDRSTARAIAVDETARIRLLEIDAPEQRTCGAKRSTKFVRQTIPTGTTVYLQGDREDTDRYDRYLRYVWLDDGRMLNRQIVRRGLAEAVLYEPNDRHWRRMRAAERTAQKADRGIWGPLCAPKPAPQPALDAAGSADDPGTDSAPAPAPAPAPEAAPPPDDTGGGCHPSYSPCVPFAADVDCLGGEGNGPAYTGRVQVIGPDEYRLDSDGDGIGCEDS